MMTDADAERALTWLDHALSVRWHHGTLSWSERVDQFTTVHRTQDAPTLREALALVLAQPHVQ